MKRVMLFFLFSIFLMSFSIKENHQLNLENKESEIKEDLIVEKFDLLLLKANEFVYKKIKSELKGDYNTALFDIVWDKDKRTISVNYIEISAIFPVIPFDESETIDVSSIKGGKSAISAVRCSGGDYDGEKTNCKGDLSCGKALFKCLEDGGSVSTRVTKVFYLYPFEQGSSGDSSGIVVLTKDKLTGLTVSY